MYWGCLLTKGRAALILGFSRARTRAHYSKTIVFAFTTFTKLRVSRWEIVRYEGNRNGVRMEPHFGARKRDFESCKMSRKKKTDRNIPVR